MDQQDISGATPDSCAERPLAASAVRRGFATIQNRQIHYRYAGSGPALILLHASPVSSQIFERDYLPVFSQHFTCIAPDTPGNGHSAALSDTSNDDVQYYVNSLVAFLDFIGVDECILYGRHTGASIALAFANTFPERARFVYCDSFPVFRSDEVPDYLGEYLAPFEPDRAGSFLAALWFRFRDQHVFWPWHLQRSDKRSDTDVPGHDFVHRGVLDFLLAGNAYIGPYRMAINTAATPLIIASGVRVCFATRPGDSLFPVQSRIANLRDGAWREELDRETPVAVRQELEILLENSDDIPSAPSLYCVSAALTEGKNVVDVAGGQVVICYSPSETDATPLIMLPHLPGGGAYLQTLAESFAKTRDVFVIDIPGHGDSVVSFPHAISAYADILSDTIKALRSRGMHLETFDLYGHRAGALVALALEQRLACRQIVLDDPLLLDSAARSALLEHYQLDFSPRWDGSHLLSLWHHLRDQDLWFPWDSRTRIAARRETWRFNLQRHYTVFVDTLKQWSNFTAGWNAALSFDARLAMREMRAKKVATWVTDNSPWTDKKLCSGLVDARPQSDTRFVGVVTSYLDDRDA